MVTKEIEVTEEQAERLKNYILGCVEHCEYDDILEAFTEGINSGDYETGHIPFGWLYDDLKLYEVEKQGETLCRTEDIDL